MPSRNLKLSALSCALIGLSTPAFAQMAGTPYGGHTVSHEVSYVMPQPVIRMMPQKYTVDLNKTQIIQLNESAGAVVVGNPAIADVSVHSDKTIFIIGRGYGETNVMILSPDGEVVMDANVEVTSVLSNQGVRVFNGSSAERSTYNCSPYCIPTPVLGDSGTFRTSNEGESIILNNQTATSSTGSIPSSPIPDYRAQSSSELNPSEF